MGTTPITMYWRPGCGFCMALQRGLDDAGVAYARVNIWEDADGAAFVRQANRGNELVPTVAIGDGDDAVVLSNPTPAQVLEAAGRADG